jgi:hypothetical protein
VKPSKLILILITGLSKIAYPMDGASNIENEALPQKIDLESIDATLMVNPVEEQNVDAPEPLNSTSRPLSPFISSSLDSLTQLPSPSAIPLVPACIPTPATPSQLPTTASDTQQSPSPAPSQNPTPRHRFPEHSQTEQQRRLSRKVTDMPSQEEELGRIRANMAFLESDPEPTMAFLCTNQRFTEEERYKLRGILQKNSSLGMGVVINDKHNDEKVRSGFGTLLNTRLQTDIELY